MSELQKREPSRPPEAWDAETLRELYRVMVTIRSFEEKVEEFFFAGEIPGFVHLYIGEEAVAAGVMAHLDGGDYIQSTHRGHGHTIAKGAELEPMMAEIFGKNTGYCKGKGGSMHIADFGVGMIGANGVVGGGYNIAVGAGLALQMQGRRGVSVVFFGDGAANRGTFHEAANLASVWKLPVLFVCENNQWASTTPYRTTTAVEDVAVRAAGYDMPGVVVDGNDVFAVYEAAGELTASIREGGGPALLECKTYRIKGHYVGDPEMYRTREEVREVFRRTDPLRIFADRVLAAGLMTAEEMDRAREESQAAVSRAVEYAERSPEPDPSELYEDLYV
ncbi:MAG: thiamine pyrophosphate-dependent dehydrogenase E1 component subunit alpha [Synergistales bacterium]|nr:thiamine pyrophosphate-dependent dehydrogenase E1 component subunit alpha [Synergistales bacterium]